MIRNAGDLTLEEIQRYIGELILTILALELKMAELESALAEARIVNVGMGT